MLERKILIQSVLRCKNAANFSRPQSIFWHFNVHLREPLSNKSTFLRNWHPVCGPVSFAAKGKNKEKK